MPPTDCWPLRYSNKCMLTNASGQISPGKITPVTQVLLQEPNFQPVAPVEPSRALSPHSQADTWQQDTGSMTSGWWKSGGV